MTGCPLAFHLHQVSGTVGWPSTALNRLALFQVLNKPGGSKHGEPVQGKRFTHEFCFPSATIHNLHWRPRLVLVNETTQNAMRFITGRQQRHNMLTPRKGGYHSTQNTKQEMKRGMTSVAFLHFKIALQFADSKEEARSSHDQLQL